MVEGLSPRRCSDATHDCTCEGVTEPIGRSRHGTLCIDVRADSWVASTHV